MSRAAEMARIMVEEWPEGEGAQSFVLRRFWKDKVSDLRLAVKIFAELEEADEIAFDWFKKING